MLAIKTIKEFKSGLIDAWEAQSIPDGAASKSKNWLTGLSHIELRRGYALFGSRDTALDGVTGLHVGLRADGTEVPFHSWRRRLYYYDSSADAWTEIGANQLPLAANNEEVSFTNYHNLAGAWTFLSSPNSDIYKIAVANPGSIRALSSTNFKGRIKAKLGRMFLWNRLGTNGRKDETGLYLSYIDKDELSDYTETTGFSVGTGDGTTKTFTATLTLSGVQTAFGCEVTDATETFSDDYNGVLNGDLGGTGTINYITGAISVTFNTAPALAQAITARYYREDSTSAGVADFSHSTPRTAGQGAIFRQDDGGGILQNVFSISDVEYCVHEKKAWQLSVTATDTGATNFIYRGRVGIPNWRAAVETGDGIYYIDDTDENKPRFKILRYTDTAQVEPNSISDNVNLEDYRFNKAATIEWGDFIVFACRHKDSSFNNNIFVYNKRYNSFDQLDYAVSSFAIYNGTLLAADPLSHNVFTLFSGLDDDGATIDNYWEGKLDDFGIESLKKFKRLVLQGSIGLSQDIDVYASFDRGAFVLLGSIDGGSTDYVDRTQATTIGSLTLGRGELGGGGDGITAFNYLREISVRQGKFDEVKLRFKATGVGWASVSLMQFKDIRKKDQRIPSSYRVTS